MPEITNERGTETVSHRFIIGAGVGVGTGDPAPTDPPADPPVDPPADPPKPKPTETVEHWKAMAREQEKRAKANAEAARKYAELEEQKKSDEQKAAERVAAAEKRAQELELKATRGEISGSTGVPVEILAGPEDATAEAIQAYADKLVEWRGKTAAPERPPFGVHVPNEGKTPPNVSLDEQIAAAQKAGNHALAIHLKRQKAHSR